VADGPLYERPFLVALVCAALVISVAVGCGPSLSEPSSLDLTGHWATANEIGALSDVQVDIAQQRDGSLAGQWSGKFGPPTAACPAGLGSNPTGSVQGTNTVLQVRFALLGAGDFEGQAIDGKTLKGSLTSCGKLFPVIFFFISHFP
jgi:hypothetical protein